MGGHNFRQHERRGHLNDAADIAATDTTRTRIAFLATLGHLHTEPLKYDLACLRALVQELEPDLLGIEAEPSEWEGGSLSSAPIEVREALVPASSVTDTVVVPLGGPVPLELSPRGLSGAFGEGPARSEGPEGSEGSRLTKAEEMRAGVLRAADRLLTGWQRDRAAQGPEAVNSRAFGHLCGLVCGLEEVAAGEAGRRSWEEANERILERLLEMVRRDPGRRVLVAVNCRRVHWLESRLRTFSGEMTLVPYERL